MAEPQYLVLEDGSMFPCPALESDEHHSPAHAIRWNGEVSRSEGLWLAACADAFAYLVANPDAARRKIPMIRRALESGDPS